MIYHPLIEEARSRRLNLLVRTPSQPIPPQVGVVITTEDESHKIDFNRHRIVLAQGTPRSIIDKALSVLFGEEFKQIIIGIDPGKYPGIAVLGDDRILSVHHVSVDEVCPMIKKLMQEYHDKNLLIRIGHGARLVRSRLINELIDLGLKVEMVDETGTTPKKGLSDILAAINIAKLKGKNVGKQFIEPSHGEVRVIQEQSREYSNGRSTIPRVLARAVAKGELTMEQALEKHKLSPFG